MASQPRGDWRAIDELVLDHPFEQAADHADQVIETPWTIARTTQEECIKNLGRDFGEGLDTDLSQMTIEQPESLFFHIVLAVQGTLVIQERRYVRRDRTRRIGKTGLHRRSSPSPRATSRSE